MPIVSIVVPFWGYLKGSLMENGLNQKKGTMMETIGKAVSRFGPLESCHIPLSSRYVNLGREYNPPHSSILIKALTTECSRRSNSQSQGTKL